MPKPLAHTWLAALVISALSVLAPPSALGDAASDYRAAVLGDGPVSYWRLDDTSGTVARDVQGVNDASVSGSPMLGQPGPMAGDLSMQMIGDQQITPGSPSSLNPPGAYTNELWFKASADEA